MVGPLPDPERSRLRKATALIEAEISRLSATPAMAEALRELRLYWDKLVGMLALGPEPEYRQCPKCRHMGMRDARKCGWCWSTLPSLVERQKPDPKPSLGDRSTLHPLKASSRS